MRVSSNQYHITVNASLQTSNSQLEKLIGQMASGNRLSRPSDDPVAHVRMARLQREESSISQYRDNIGALSSRMTQNESVLTSINKDLLSTRDMLVWALDGANTNENLAAMATNLTSLRDALHASSITKDQEGVYMFSGTKSNMPTVELEKAQVAGQRYKAGGNTEQQMVAVGNGLSQPANVTLGDEMAAVLNQLDAAIAAIEGGATTSNDPVARELLTTAMAGVDTAMDQVSTKISKLGGTQNIIATLDDNWANLSLANESAMVEYGQLDYAEAAVRLNALTAAIQATQGAYGKVSQLSLFNVL